MKTFILATLLVLPLCASAADWQPLTAPRADGSGSFIDLDSPVQMGEFVQVRVLTNFKRAQKGALSARDTFRVDCKKKFIGLAVTETFAESDAQGAALESFVAKNVPMQNSEKGTLGSSIIHEVCGKR